MQENNMSHAEKVEWMQAGVWVMTLEDPDYPEQLKRRLGAKTPQVLFGCGQRRLLQMDGLGVVGSRDASLDDLAFTKNLGGVLAAQRLGVFSGCARGVDQTAMFGALERGGCAVGVLGDGLLKAASSSKYRRYLLTGKLALVSPFDPRGAFSVGKAMGRNKYIYCLADATTVVCSVANKGGTWAGAIEVLRAGWAPVWVKNSTAQNSGNPELTRRGGVRLPQDLSDIRRRLLVLGNRQRSN